MKKLMIAFMGMIAAVIFADTAFADFKKIGADGQELSDSATEWVAVKDTLTGLTWEKKTAANKDEKCCTVETPQDPDDPDISYCTNSVQDYIDTLNQAHLGGFTDWRVPTIGELATIADFTKTTAPVINAAYFPNINNDYYWTSTDHAVGGVSVTYNPETGHNVYNYIQKWRVNFLNGTNSGIDKTAKQYVMAVRGTSSPPPSFTAYTQNTVKENISGLIWQKTPGSATKKWADIAAYLDTLPGVQVDGIYYGWKLPTLQELRSIIYYEKYQPAETNPSPAIYSTYFSAASAEYWTATPYAANSTSAWFINFTDGMAAYTARTAAYRVWAIVDKTKIVDPPAYPLGDITHDGNVDLVDVIAGLKILDGISVTVYTDKEVNSDGKIGHEEVIYALQVAATLRPQ